MATEPERYNSREIARAAGLIGLAVVRTLAGKDLGPVDRRISRLQAGACQREADEREAAEQAAKASRKR
jgi:hypothetical protein